MKEYLKKITKDTAWVLVLNAVNYAGSFIIAVLVTRFLGVDELGIFTLIATSASLVYLVADFGLTTLTVRKIKEDRNSAVSSVAAVNSLKLALGSVLVLLLTGAGLLFNIMKIDAALLAGLAAVFPRLFQTTYEASIRSFLNQKIPTLTRSLNSALQLVSGYIILASGFGLDAVFSVILLFEILTAVFFRFANTSMLRKNKVEVKPFRTDKNFLRSLLKESSVLFANNSLAFSIPRLNIILLEYIKSVSSVGIFSAGYRFTGGIGLLSGALYNSFYPFLSSLGSDKKTAYELTKRILKYVIPAGFIVSLGLFASAGLLVDLTFRIEEAKEVLRITSFSVIPILSYTVIQSFFISFYGEKFLLRSFSAAWVINLVLSSVLIYYKDYSGCAAATLIIEYFLMFVQMTGFYRHRSRVI